MFLWRLSDQLLSYFIWFNEDQALVYKIMLSHVLQVLVRLVMFLMFLNHLSHAGTYRVDASIRCRLLLANWTSNKYLGGAIVPTNVPIHTRDH